MIWRKKIYLLMLFGGAGLVFAMVLLGISRFGHPFGNSNPQAFVGHWEHVDQYGRTVTWIISADGTLRRYAADDLTDVGIYEWWSRNDTLVMRNPLPPIERLYHAALYPVTGRSFENERVEFRIATANENSLTLVIPDNGLAIELVRSGDARSGGVH